MDDKGDTSKKQPQHQKTQTQQQQHQHQQAQHVSSSPQATHEETITETRPVNLVSGATPFISSPLYVSSGASSSPFDQQFESLNTKRPRYSGQWKLLPSPTQQTQQQKHSQMIMLPTESTTPSPSNQQQQLQLTHNVVATTASSSETTSSPTHSPIPLLSGGSEGNNKQEGEQVHQQLRKGKYVSPVWKPNEMLWLAKAWKEQYQGGSDSSSREQQGELLGSTRGKTRAEKDKEVAEFLRRNGVNRDAKTAGTKWDNMLGEFRKVYEWERGSEREHVGKSYFRLSPYERKLHRLPASFDEEVFEELSQFMGSRMRSSHGVRAGSSFVSSDEGRTRSLPPPRPFKDDELPLSGLH